MYTTFLFPAHETSDKRMIYGDFGQKQMKTKFRPMVGDLIPFSGWTTPPEPPFSEETGLTGVKAALDQGYDFILLKIEAIMIVAPDKFHAYCYVVGAVKPGQWNDCNGERGDLESLLWHYVEQANSFAKIYAEK